MDFKNISQNIQMTLEHTSVFRLFFNCIIKYVAMLTQIITCQIMTCTPVPTLMLVIIRYIWPIEGDRELPLPNHTENNNYRPIYNEKLRKKLMFASWYDMMWYDIICANICFPFMSPFSVCWHLLCLTCIHKPILCIFAGFILCIFCWLLT